MTVAAASNTVSYTGNGATTVWSFNFYFLAASTIVVQEEVIATGAKSVIASNLYSVTGAGNDDPPGGSVTYPLSGPALPNTKKIHITRILPLSQELNILPQAAFNPTTLEQQLDKIVMQVQQVSSNVDAVDVAVLNAAVVAAQTAKIGAEAAETNAIAQAALTDADRIAAEAAKLAAEAAANEAEGHAATATADIYPNTTEGLLATTSGQYFYVSPSANAEGLLDLYLNSAGSAVLQGTQPSTVVLGQTLVARDAAQDAAAAALVSENQSASNASLTAAHVTAAGVARAGAETAETGAEAALAAVLDALDGNVITAPITISVASKAALAAITDRPAGRLAYMHADGLEGMFVFVASNLSAEVTADVDQGIYIAPASASTGASGAWVRQVPNKRYELTWFGTNTVEENSQVRITRALALIPDGSTIFLPPYEIGLTYQIHSAGNSIRIYGYGWGKSILRARTATKDFHGITIAGDDTEVAFFSVRGIGGQATPGEASGVHYLDPAGLRSPKRHVCHHIHVDTAATGVRCGYWGQVISGGSGLTTPVTTAFGSQYIEVYGCLLQNIARQGIEAIGCSEVHFHDNHITMIDEPAFANRRGVRISGATKVKIRDNTIIADPISTGGYGVQVAAAALFTDPDNYIAPEEVHITGNTFKNFDDGINVDEAYVLLKITDNVIIGNGPNDARPRKMFRFSNLSHTYPNNAYSAHLIGTPIPNTIVGGWKGKAINVFVSNNVGVWITQFAVIEGMSVGMRFDSNYMFGTSSNSSTYAIQINGGPSIYDYPYHLEIMNNTIISGYIGSGGVIRVNAGDDGGRVYVDGNTFTDPLLASYSATHANFLIIARDRQSNIHLPNTTYAAMLAGHSAEERTP